MIGIIDNGALHLVFILQIYFPGRYRRELVKQPPKRPHLVREGIVLKKVIIPHIGACPGHLPAIPWICKASVILPEPMGLPGSFVDDLGATA